MHPTKPYGLDVWPIRLIQLHRDISLHAEHIGDFHRATQIDNRARVAAAELSKLWQDPHRAQTFGDRATDRAARREILIKLRAQ